MQFWEFNVGNLFTLAGVIGGYIWNASKLTAKLESNVAQLSKESQDRFAANKATGDRLTESVLQLNERGGVATRGRLAVLEKAMDDHGHRLRNLEASLPMLNEKISVIASNIEWIKNKLDH